METFDDLEVDDETVFEENEELMARCSEDYEIFAEGINWDDVDMIDQDVKEEIGLKFINEQNIICVVAEEEETSTPTSHVPEIFYHCPSCKKKYKREGYFERHVLICGKNFHCLFYNCIPATCEARPLCWWKYIIILIIHYKVVTMKMFGIITSLRFMIIM